MAWRQYWNTPDFECMHSAAAGAPREKIRTEDVAASANINQMVVNS